MRNIVIKKRKTDQYQQLGKVPYVKNLFKLLKSPLCNYNNLNCYNYCQDPLYSSVVLKVPTSLIILKIFQDS